MKQKAALKSSTAMKQFRLRFGKTPIAIFLGTFFIFGLMGCASRSTTEGDRALAKRIESMTARYENKTEPPTHFDD